MNQQSKEMDDNLVIEDSASKGQDAEKADALDDNDVDQSDSDNESWDSSSEEEEEEEVPEDKESSTPIGVDLVQASEVDENKIAERDENVDNEGGGDPSKEESVIAKSIPLCETHPGTGNENMVLQKLIRGPRYFDPESSWPTSYVSNKDYDEEDKQKNRKKRKPCYLCADTQHEGKRCKMVSTCLICSKLGHLITDCPEKNIEADDTSILCLKCGNTGHDMFSCGNEYDTEDLKEITCYICKESGHLSCVENKTEGLIEPTCYNCGESGHLGSGCTNLNEAAIDLLSMPMCSKCTKRGHPRPGCAKCLKARKAKSKETTMEKDATAAGPTKGKKSRKRKRARPVPPINYRSQGPPIRNTWYRPRSNVWLSPAAAAARNGPPTGGLPSGQNSINQIPQNPFYPMTQLPHLIMNSQQGIQIRSPQVPFYPMTQLPHLMWNVQRGTQIPEPSLHLQIGIQLPRAEIPTPQNSFYPMTQRPHLIWNGGQMVTQIPLQTRNHPSGNQNYSAKSNPQSNVGSTSS